MQITVQELELHRIVVSKDYPPGDLDYHGAEFRQTDLLRVDAVAELLGSEIRVRGHLRTHLEASCDRCLAEVEIPVDRDFDLFYRPLATIAREEEVEVPQDELDIAFYSGDGIALDDLVTEQVILSVPMKVVCGVNCQGLCPVCGKNRNLERCTCPEPIGDSPFSTLLE
jgi:uncharacterized protein